MWQAKDTSRDHKCLRYQKNFNLIISPLIRYFINRMVLLYITKNFPPEAS